MSDNSSMGSAFVKGVGALLAALALFVAEQYIQRHYFSDTSQPHTKNGGHPPRPATIPIDGRVIDASGTKVIENAVVDLSIGEMHQDQNTDSEGRYAFSLEGFDPNTAASMNIKAQGYKDSTVNLLLGAMEEDKELKLEALAPPPGKGIGAVVGATYVGPSQPAKPLAALQYVKRVDPKVLIAHK